MEQADTLIKIVGSFGYESRDRFPRRISHDGGTEPRRISYTGIPIGVATVQHLNDQIDITAQILTDFFNFFGGVRPANLIE